MSRLTDLINGKPVSLASISDFLAMADGAYAGREIALCQAMTRLESRLLSYPDVTTTLYPITVTWSDGKRYLEVTPSSGPVVATTTLTIKGGGREMRSIQEIFDVVINGGYYGPLPHARPHMCYALSAAYKDCQISRIEYDFALAEIEAYITKRCNTMTRYIFINHPELFEHKNKKRKWNDWTHIYRDWASRPIRTSQEADQ